MVQTKARSCVTFGLVRCTWAQGDARSSSCAATGAVRAAAVAMRSAATTVGPDVSHLAIESVCNCVEVVPTADRTDDVPVMRIHDRAVRVKAWL